MARLQRYWASQPTFRPARPTLVPIESDSRKLVKVSVTSADGSLRNTFEVTTLEEARELIAVMECPALSVGDSIRLDEVDE